MRNTLAVARREFVSYFNSPIAFIAIPAYLTVAAWMFFPDLFLQAQADLRPFFQMAPMLFFIFTPMFTMRLLAEEKAQGTLELMLTMPITDWQVVLGKFFASVGLLSVLLLLSLAYPISVSFLGPIDKGAVVAGYFGMLLMASTYAAIGLTASSLTRNQIVAGIVALAIGFGLFIIGIYTPLMGPGLASVANAISIQSHFMNIARGVVDTRDVLYYVSMIAGCLLVATTSLESRRWR